MYFIFIVLYHRYYIIKNLCNCNVEYALKCIIFITVFTIICVMSQHSTWICILFEIYAQAKTYK